MKRYIWIETNEPNKNRILLKLFKQRINVYEVIENEKSILFKIAKEDQKKLKKIIGIKFKKRKESGIFGILEAMKTKWIILSGLILFCLFIFFFSHIIVSVDVIHSNKEIRDLVTKELENYGIKKLTIKKDFQALSKIKEEILKKHPEDLEWIEIETNGMKYTVRIEERIITKEKEKKERCHIIATKSAIVKKILYEQGEAIVDVNDFVSEGDILISGILMANEKPMENVCATGSVYGEVWYTTKVSLPMDYEKKEETGKVRWNFSWTKGDITKNILRPRLENYVEEKKHLFTIFGIEFDFVKQKEVEIEKKTYSEEEALEKALELTDEKINTTLEEEEEIISKKVLKKGINNSTMEVEVFVSVIENISRQEEFQEMKKEG